MFVPEFPRPTAEGVWRRALVDTLSVSKWREFIWQLCLALLLVGVARVTGVALLIENAWLSVAFIAATAVLSLALRFAWNLFRAPYRQRDEARSLLIGSTLQAGIDRDKLAKHVRQVLTVAVDDLSSQIPPAARSLSPHFPNRVAKLASMVNFALHDGPRRRTLSSAMARWIPKYAHADRRLDISDFCNAAKDVAEAIAAIQGEDINVSVIAEDDTWETWVVPVRPGTDVDRAKRVGKEQVHA